MQLFTHTAPETDCYDIRNISAYRLYDGSTDITISVRETDADMELMLHNLPISEADKLGVALCKDIIDNYTRHNANLKDKITDLEDADRETRYRNTNLMERVENLEYKNATLARTAFEHDNEQAATIDELHDEVAGLQLELNDCRKTFGTIDEEYGDLMTERNEYQETLRLERIDHMIEKRAINQTHHDIHRSNNSIIEELESEIVDLRDRVRERNHTINDTIIEHNNHTQQLYDRIEELEAENTSMEQCTNLHNLCFAADPVHCENIGVPVYGMRCQNFERMTKGYRGTLSRHGKTIVIALPFEHEIVAKNAVEYITGHEV